MGGLLVAFVISFTAVTVVLVGILAAYAAVTGILYAFAYGSRRRARQRHLGHSGTQPKPSQRRLKPDFGPQISDLRLRTSDLNTIFLGWKLLLFRGGARRARRPSSI